MIAEGRISTERCRAVLVMALLLLLVSGLSLGVLASDGDIEERQIAAYHIEMGIYYRLWGLKDFANRHFERAMNTGVNRSETALAAGTVSYIVGDYADALRWFDRDGYQGENAAVMHVLEASIFMNQAASGFVGSSSPSRTSLYRDARLALERALDLEPDMLAAKFLLATVHAIERRYEQAQSLLLSIPDGQRMDGVARLLERIREEL